MRDLGSTEQTGGGLASQALIWGGVLLLIVGSLLTYPYVRSRLITLPPTPPPTPGNRILSEKPGLSPPPAATAVAPTLPRPHTPTLPHSHTPSPPPPSPTSAPALPTHIVIPVIGVDAPVIPVSWQTIEVDGQEQAAWEVLDMYGAGWHETSAPLGVAGNTVLNGHNTTNGEVFRDLYTLEAGDVITVYSDDTPYAYAVAEVLILPEADQPLEVRLENARYILPTEDERLTLVTCHPYGSLRYRLIVIAYPNSE